LPFESLQHPLAVYEQLLEFHPRACSKSRGRVDVHRAVAPLECLSVALVDSRDAAQGIVFVPYVVRAQCSALRHRLNNANGSG